MRFLAGIGLMAIGVVLGLWAGVWWAFIGGIVDVINAIKAPELSAMAVAIGVAKVLFSSLIGLASAMFPVAIGSAMLK